MAVHVLVGNVANGADSELERLAATGDIAGWTVPRVARTGDDVVFYLLNPVGAFVAAGRLLTDARPGTSYQGDGKYLADVGDVRQLPGRVARLDMVRLVPGWGWPTQPHTATTVPHKHLSRFRAALT